jgi:hypothetical protein
MLSVLCLHILVVLTPFMVQKLSGDNTRQVTQRLTLLPLSKASIDFITFYRILHHTLYFLH